MLRLDPDNRYALMNLQKLHEEQHQWQEAYQLQQQVAALDPGRRPDPHQRRPRVSRERDRRRGAKRAGDAGEAARRFQAAIELDPHAVPAYLNLGDVRLRAGGSGAGDRHLGARDRACRRSAPIWRSTGSQAAYPLVQATGTVRRAVPGADRRVTRRTGARGWRSPAT